MREYRVQVARLFGKTENFSFDTVEAAREKFNSLSPTKHELVSIDHREQWATDPKRFSWNTIDQKEG